jgi:DNA-binding NarL/FixJ family response regulator
MRATAIHTSKISIGLLERDPLRQVGMHSILDRIPEFRVMDMTATEMAANPDVDVMILGDHSPQFLDTMTQLRAARPGVRVVVTGMAMDDEAVLNAIVYGAKGCVDESSATASFAQAIKAVHGGSVWAPRRVMSMLIERSSDLLRHRPIGSVHLTSRQKQVLNMLVEGRSNKEIAVLMGIEVRTVKAHIASLLRKMGVRNRIALSIQAIKQSLVQTQ